jgi:hypothetical protein
MATTAVSRRVVRLPNSPVGVAQQVRAELLAKMNSLKLAGTQVFITYSDVGLSMSENPLVQFEVSLIAANDTTLVSSFAGWATLLGVPLLDTEVAAFTSGH